MDGKEKSVPDRQFEEKVQKQTDLARKTFEKSMKKKISSHVRNKSDAGTIVEENMKRIFEDKSEEMQKKVLDLRRMQDVEIQAVEDWLFLAKHEKAMKSLQDRFDLAMEISGGESGKIETDAELEHFKRTGLFMLEAMHTEWIFDFGAALTEAPSEASEKDFLAIVGRLGEDPESLSPADAELLAKEVRKLTRTVSKDQLPDGGEGVGIFLLAYLSEAQRADLMRYMMPEPGTYDLVTDLVKMDYISPTTAEVLFQEEIARLEANRKGKRLGIRREIDEQVATVEEEIVAVNSKETKKTRKRVRVAKKQAIRSMKRSFGHKNRAKSLFSLKGMASALAVANGSMIVGANILSNLHEPFDIVANPYLWLGVGMTAGGLELSGGLDDLAPTLGRDGWARLAKDGKAFDEEKVADREKEMQKSLTENKEAATLYYNKIEEIIAIRNEKKRTNPDETPRITLAALGLSADSPEFQERYPGLSRMKAEELLTEWTRYFFETGLGVKRIEAEQQRTFLEETFKPTGYEIPNFNA